MPWSKVLNFSDPEPYTAAVLSADTEIFPTRAGQFEAELTQVKFDKLQMQRFKENLPRVHKAAISLDRKVFTFLTADQPIVSKCGRILSLGEICEDNFEMQHLRTEGSYRYGGVSLLPKDFAAACGSILGCEIDPEPNTRYIRPAAELMEWFLTLHMMIGGLAKTSPQLLELPEVGRALEQDLVHALVRCVTEGVVSPVSTGSLRQRGIVKTFEDFLEANPKTPLYLPEVCAAIGVAERTLRAACEEHIGMGPVRYLALRRMHLARRALLRATPSTTTVTRVAADHGFLEMGRFAGTYRALFGESPSTTMRRSSVTGS